MADEEEIPEEEPKKASKLPLILGVVLAIAGGGGGFYAGSAGLILAPESHAKEMKAEPEEELPDIAYVEMDPLTISLAAGSANRHLRFRTQIEVPRDYQSDVELVKPRITDVMNSYLRALETADLESPSALIRIRSQLLRRIQVVTGPGRVRDLLIMEFVLN